MKYEADQKLPMAAQQISATDAARNFANVRRLAHLAPVVISAHNKDRQVLLDYDLYEALAMRGQDSKMIERLNAKLSLTLETIDTYVCIMDSAGRIRRVNNSLLAAIQRDNEYLAGLLIEEVFTEPSFRYVIERVREVIETQTAARFEQPSPMNPDRILSFRIMPWPGGVSLFADDITERANLREDRARASAMRAALDLFDDIGRGVVDSTGITREASPTFLKLIGSREATMLGSRFVSLFAPASRSVIESAMQSGKDVQSLAVEYLAGGVRTTPAQLALSAYWNGASGHSHGFVMRSL